MISAAGALPERDFVAEVTSLFTEDPDIDEIGIIHLDDDHDTFVLDEHKLGIAMSKIPAIHRQAKTSFFHANKFNDVDGILKASRCMLLVCADFYTAWNARKTLISQGIVTEEAEMKFSRLILTHHAKSIDTWAHRRWVLQRLVPRLEGDNLAPFLARELSLCAKLCEEFPRNYFAWSYRYCICTKLPLPLLLTEFHDTSRTWCQRHLSDSSAWNLRLLVLLLLLPRVAQPLAVVADELAAHSRLQTMYPDRDALWCHRRALLKIAASQLSIRSPAVWSTDTTLPNFEWTSATAVDAFIRREVQFSADVGTAGALRYALFGLDWILKREDRHTLPPRVTEWHAETCRRLSIADAIRAQFWLGRLTSDQRSAESTTP
ncbi:hypothetical protein H310_10322 [Aphanomyces invadans]|uniref:Uncharacterized protein n=1 Tax=Aphanomyces invadans TaxID=157072 RepID=A0A024TRH1_9STRA|nr:hypothetical protein H310_10322 [Aphanomyces invadans]ETV96628.1 hypothetical protein H310_10322 [Aphanomyces invadans]|eukprot:XP_008874891.1 hypothetical protein H310_10322 [Aphanomyces invadans]